MATETIRTGSRDVPPRRSRARIVVGISLLAGGVFLLAATGGYYLYGRLAHSNLDDLDFESERPQFAGQGYVGTALPGTGSPLEAPPSTGAVAPNEPPAASAGASQGAGQVEGGASKGIGADSTAAVQAPATQPTSAAMSVPTPAAAAVVPSGPRQIGAGSGADSFGQTEDSEGTSQAGGAPAPAATAVPSANVSRTPSSSVTTRPTPADGAGSSDSPDTQRFTRLDTEPSSSGGVARTPEPDPRLAELAAAIEASIYEVRTYFVPTPQDLASGGALAKRIRIPAIEVDAIVDELRIRQLGNSLAWETPKKVVGHIPATAKAGAAGQGWYFGHLESPIRGEGNVFARLPEIPELAADSPIFIFLETADRHYAYQVYVTEVIHEDEIALSDSGAHDITLVTCTPRFYYDYRLLVTAALVGIREV